MGRDFRRLVSQSEEGGHGRSWQRREGACQVCRGLKPEFTLDVTEVRSHGTFLSREWLLGGGPGWNGLRKREMQESCCYKSLLKSMMSP